MCGLCNTAGALDRERSDVFAERLVGSMNAAAVGMMLSVGHRTGLFDAMAGAGGLTSVELARRAGLQERYVREWLGAMVTGDVVSYDPEGQRYELPAEHAAYLTRAAGGDNIAAGMQWVSVLGGVESEVVRCFRDGGGVPYERFARFHDVMADESAGTVVGALEAHILPLVPGLIERLESGIEVLDIGCGKGRAMAALARRFPRSRFVGLDLCHEAIEKGREEIASAGLTNIQLRTEDVAFMEFEGRFDLVTAFDAIHDQRDPASVLANVRRSLRPGGVFLMQDIAGSSDVEKNIGGPVAPFIYTISCMHCMTVSLAQGGAGLGAAWGEELAQRMLGEAGFGSVETRTLEHDFMNTYYVCRPG